MSFEFDPNEHTFEYSELHGKEGRMVVSDNDGTTLVSFHSEGKVYFLIAEDTKRKPLDFSCPQCHTEGIVKEWQWNSLGRAAWCFCPKCKYKWHVYSDRG